jgi:uncharacterized damage-inducible protein DinB
MSDPEVWLCGPVAGVPPLLQPVAHSLLQSRRELAAALRDLAPAELRARPAGAASVEFHVRHAMGSLDRLTTYARGEQLGPTQLAALRVEQEPEPHGAGEARLVEAFDAAVERALRQLCETPDTALLAPREVGRARLPSTVIGLLVHAAEHTQRHVGQLVTTARIVRGSRGVAQSSQAP